MKKLIFFATICIGLFFNSCSNDPCKELNCNNGTCIEGTCNCNEGFEGTFCDSEIRSPFIGQWTGTLNCNLILDNIEVNNIQATLTISADPNNIKGLIMINDIALPAEFTDLPVSGNGVVEDDVFILEDISQDFSTEGIEIGNLELPETILVTGGGSGVINDLGELELSLKVDTAITKDICLLILTKN